jgi:hypothetical protein
MRVLGVTPSLAGLTPSICKPLPPFPVPAGVLRFSAHFTVRREVYSAAGETTEGGTAGGPFAGGSP